MVRCLTGAVRRLRRQKPSIRSPDETVLSQPFHVPVTSLKQCRATEFGEKFTMSDVALPGSIEPAAGINKGPKLDHGINPLQGIIYLGVLAAALLFVAYSIYDH